MCVISSTFGSFARTATSIANAVSSVASTIATNKQTNAQYEYERKINERNARIAEINAANERQLGIEEARRTQIEARQRVGLQMATMAANGIDITSGNALDVIEYTTTMGELDALMIKYNAEKSAQAYENQGNNYLLQSNLLHSAQKNSKVAGSIDLINSGLSIVSNNYQKM